MRLNKRWRIVAGFAVALATLAIGFRLLLPVAATLLVRDDQPYQKADLIVMLMGDSSASRASLAYDLYATKVAPKIVFNEEKPHDFELLFVKKTAGEIVRMYLEKKGVPAEAITIVDGCNATSTSEEARCTRKYVESLPPTEKVNRIVLVTSWYHTQRAHWLFNRAFADTGVTVDVAAAPLPDTSPAVWWREETSLLAVFNEYLKWSYWLIKQPQLAPKS